MTLADKARDYRENLDKETVLQKSKENWHLGGLTAIFVLAFTLRYMPERGMQYLQAADPYYIFRMSQHIAFEGHLPQLDFMRYAPYAVPNYTVQLGELLIPAVLYNAGFGLFFQNYLEWAQFYPALMGASTVVLMYFLGKELFNKNAGLAAAFFLTVTSAALRRASAGFFEKEPIGTFLMVLSLLFFTRAWKYHEWKDGIFSGIALGLFTISWGGSQMLWLLYPILAGITLFINEETRSLITSYTPTVLVAGFMAAAANPARFWFTDELFLISIGVLGLLWARYLVEEFELIQDRYLPYFVPSMSVLGGFMALLSPIYSQWLAGKILRVIQVALGNTANTVFGQTVQENAPPEIPALASELGSILIGNTNPAIGALATLFSPWNLMLFAVTIMSAMLLLMLGRKYNILDEALDGKKHIAYIQAVFISLMILAVGLLLNQVFISAFVAVVAAVSTLSMVYALDGDSAFTIMLMFLSGLFVSLIIASIRVSSGLTSPFSYLTVIPTVSAVVGSLVLYKFDYFPEFEINYNWLLLIPLVWIISNVYGGTTRSRLVFLSAFSVALGAGYTFEIVVRKLRNIDYSSLESFDTENLWKILVIVLVVLTAGFNIFSAFITAQGISGSPQPTPEIWEQSIDFMQDTPEGSTVLSWWDYGYHFQTLGRTSSVGDGGNLYTYTSDGGDFLNIPLARYLNSTPANDTRFIEKHSADYIWLDNSMIGKFTPVSQIANQDAQNFQSISRVSTPGSLQNSISQDGNQTVANFRGRIGRTPINVFAPVDFTNTSAEITGAPTVRFQNGQSAQIGCVLTENGREEYDVETELEYCAAEDPFYSLERGTAGGQSRIALVPQQISNSTFVKLYLQDGYGVPYAEKIPEASNGYIKMWEITE